MRPLRQTAQDFQRCLEEEERQEEVQKEVAPGVQASTTLEARGGRVQREDPTKHPMPSSPDTETSR